MRDLAVGAEMTTTDKNDSQNNSAPFLASELPASSGGELRDEQGEDAASAHDGHTRRKVVSHGIKLAFVAPVISTFLAKEAYAGSGYCSPIGANCSQDSDCCSGVCDTLSSHECIAAFF
jgi:hypothetical protein